MKRIITVLAVLLLIVGCGPQESDEKTIKIGASALPHADFLKQIEGPLNQAGYKLEIIVFNDYNIPNVQLDDGTLDANYFQHIPYLNNFNKTQGTDLVDVLKVHYEPIAIYGGKKDSLEAVEDGDIVFVPNDATNLPRALNLLEELGWISLNDNKETATLKDITAFKVAIEIKEVQSDGIVPLLNDGDYAIINGNYALAGNVTDKGLQKETISSEKIDDIANVIAVKKGNETSDKTKAILAAFEDKAVKDYVASQYAPAVSSVLGE